MKKLLDYLARPVLELADRIPYKRYVYFTAGVLIACLVLMAAIFCNARCGPRSSFRRSP